MATDPLDTRPVDPRAVDTRSGSRSTRLGLVTYGFVIGVVVTLILTFVLKAIF